MTVGPEIRPNPPTLSHQQYLHPQETAVAGKLPAYRHFVPILAGRNRLAKGKRPKDLRQCELTKKHSISRIEAPPFERWFCPRGVSMIVRFLSPLALILWISSLSVAFAQIQGPLEVTPAVQHDVSEPIRNIPLLPPEDGEQVQAMQALATTQQDTVLQTQMGVSSAPATLQNFDGVGNGFAGSQGSFSVNAAVPSAHGAVGATQYVQWVNTSFAVFDKTTGAVVYGPAAGNSLWTGFSGDCETTNDGDPVVQYDKLAGRWVMTQLAGSGVAPFTQCVAVSTTSDATGSYYRYAFPQPYFNDYAKLGVWPDAYYVTFNMFNGNSFIGARACALDRASMLVGASATQQCVQFLNAVDSLLPSDLDGAPAPPAGSPNYLMTYTANYLRLWKFHVDFANPAYTTTTGPFVMAAAPFSEACGGVGACIPQLGTTQLLNSVGDRPMYRLAYRNFGDHEALVVNHSVSTAAAVGVRWYEVRNLSGYPTIYQQGTYAPDSNYRWMGSIATDQSGNVALGYSVSSSTMKPSIGYTGRAPADPLGTMGNETIVIFGSGSQTGTPRWGEYTSMSIDPVDDCTFWYTSEYLQSDGMLNWSTRIASFRFPSCGTVAAPDFVLSTTPSSNTVIQGSGTSYTVAVSPIQGFTGNVNLSLSGLPAGAGYSFNAQSVAGSGNSTLTITTSSVTPPGTYPLTITGTSSNLVHSTSLSLVVTAAVPDFTLTVTAPSNIVVQGAGMSYTVTVSALYGFTAKTDLSVSGLPAGAGYNFNPASVAGRGTSTLTITTSTSTPMGLYPLTITGTSDTLLRSATVTLSVMPVPDFTLTAAPSSSTVIQGYGTSYTAKVSALYGFAANVGLSLSGLPAGAAYSFDFPSVAGSGTSILAITTASSTPAGTYSLTITATSGRLVHSTAVSLVVLPLPDFTVTATPSSRIVGRGGATRYNITVTPVGGFNAGVDLSISGLPYGTSASFSRGSVVGSGSSVLIVDTARSTRPGIYTLTIKGTSGSLSHTKIVTLVVQW